MSSTLPRPLDWWRCPWCWIPSLLLLRLNQTPVTAPVPPDWWSHDLPQCVKLTWCLHPPDIPVKDDASLFFLVWIKREKIKKIARWFWEWGAGRLQTPDQEGVVPKALASLCCITKRQITLLWLLAATFLAEMGWRWTFLDHAHTQGSHPPRRFRLGRSPSFIHMHNATRWCFPDSFFPPAGPESHLRLKRFQLLSFPSISFTYLVSPKPLCPPCPSPSSFTNFHSNSWPKQSSAKQKVERQSHESFRWRRQNTTSRAIFQRWYHHLSTTSPHPTE